MNDELQQALLNIINGASAFVGEQAPDVVRELLAWNLVYNAIWLPLNLLIGYVAYRSFRKIYAMSLSGENWTREYNCLSGFGFVALWASGLFMVFGPVIATENAETIIKITVAPKVYLLEYAADLVKDKN